MAQKVRAVLKPPYKHLVQKPDLCGPCCLSMALLRRGVWIDQEEIAFHLKTPIYFKNKSIYSFKLPAVKYEDTGNYLAEFDGKLMKKFLKKFKLPVKTKVIG